MTGKRHNDTLVTLALDSFNAPPFPAFQAANSHQTAAGAGKLFPFGFSFSSGKAGSGVDAEAPARFGSKAKQASERKWIMTREGRSMMGVCLSLFNVVA